MRNLKNRDVNCFPRVTGFISRLDPTGHVLTSSSHWVCKYTLSTSTNPVLVRTDPCKDREDAERRRGERPEHAVQSTGVCRIPPQRSVKTEAWDTQDAKRIGNA